MITSFRDQPLPPVLPTKRHWRDRLAVVGVIVVGLLGAAVVALLGFAVLMMPW